MLAAAFRRLFHRPALLQGGTEPRPLRILGLAVVKNEQDIIEPFLRHNARLLDVLVVLDNASVDETRRIAMDCARELGNVVIGDDLEFRLVQELRMGRMLQACQSAFLADYVIILDADEFLSSPDRTALDAVLARIPPGGIGRMRWRSFVVRPGGEAKAEADPPRGLTHRRAEEQPAFCKILLRLDGRLPDAVLPEEGNHNISIGGQYPEGVALPDLPLWHFPVRSAPQIAAKCITAWAARLTRNPDARNQVNGFQWRRAFDTLAEGGMQAIADTLPEMSLHYAQDRSDTDWARDAVPEETGFDYVRRHSDGSFADPLRLVARSWEKGLATRPALLGKPVEAASGHEARQFLDVAPFRFMAEKHRPDSVLDLGCGDGLTLALFGSLGAGRITGIDRVPEGSLAGVLAPACYRRADLSAPLHLGARFDLVLCVEVAAALPPAAGGILLDSIARHAGERIIFSAAEPGQPGDGHINCRSLADWLRDWAARGWVPELIDSLGMRALANLSWFRRNLVVLRRGSPSEGAAATRVLAEIAARPYAWYGQPPGIREFPFLPPLLQAGQGHVEPAGTGIKS